MKDTLWTDFKLSEHNRKQMKRLLDFRCIVRVGMYSDWFEEKDRLMLISQQPLTYLTQDEIDIYWKT